MDEERTALAATIGIPLAALGAKKVYDHVKREDARLRTDGMLLRNGRGEIVPLTGVGYGHYGHLQSKAVDGKVWPSPFEKQFEWMNRMGFNAIRLALVWESFDAYSEAWDELEKILEWCDKYEIYAIVQNHNYGLSSYFDHLGIPPRFCKGYTDETNAMYDLLWRRGKMGERDVWREMGDFLSDLARVAKHHKHIAGYWLLNEIPSRAACQKEKCCYQTRKLQYYLADRVREVDPSRIIFYRGVIRIPLLPFQPPMSIPNSVYVFNKDRWPGHRKPEGPEGERYSSQMRVMQKKWKVPIATLEVGPWTEEESKTIFHGTPVREWFMDRWMDWGWSWAVWRWWNYLRAGRGYPKSELLWWFARKAREMQKNIN